MEMRKFAKIKKLHSEHFAIYLTMYNRYRNVIYGDLKHIVLAFKRAILQFYTTYTFSVTGPNARNKVCRDLPKLILEPED